MKGPENKGGVAFAVVVTVVSLGFCLAIGLGETTRRGIPVWVLMVLAAGAGFAMIIEYWRRPRSPGGNDPQGITEGEQSSSFLTRGAKWVLGFYGLWVVIPVAVVLIAALL